MDIKTKFSRLWVKAALLLVLLGAFTTLIN